MLGPCCGLGNSFALHAASPFLHQHGLSLVGLGMQSVELLVAGFEPMSAFKLVILQVQRLSCSKTHRVSRASKVIQIGLIGLDTALGAGRAHARMLRWSQPVHALCRGEGPGDSKTVWIPLEAA